MASLLPASAPATTQVVLRLTEPHTLPPAASIRAWAWLRGRPSRVPVSTKVWPSRGRSPAGAAAACRSPSAAAREKPRPSSSASSAWLAGVANHCCSDWAISPPIPNTAVISSGLFCAAVASSAALGKARASALAFTSPTWWMPRP